MPRQYRPNSAFVDDRIENPNVDVQAIRDIAERAVTGKLLVFPVTQGATIQEFIADDTPDEGPEAIARWVTLLDRAEELQAESDPTHPCAQKQVRRAIGSLFLYEHQLTPDTRREAREFLWQRDRAKPLPASSVCLEWANCRCRNCRVERALGRPSVAVAGVILPTPSAPSESAALPSPTKQRHLWLVSEQAS